MRRKLLPVAGVALVSLAAAAVWLRQGRVEVFYTGFVEGEERILRSEVSGRVLAVDFGEGDPVPGDAVVARVDAAEVASAIASKEQEIEVIEAQVRQQQQEVALGEETWRRDVLVRRAEVDQADAGAQLAARELAREEKLFQSHVSSTSSLDVARARRSETASTLRRARELLGRAQAEEAAVLRERRRLEVLEETRDLALRQLDELHVQRAKHEIRAPAVATVVQSQLLWPGELARPGIPVLSVLDPRDKYVQVFVPVADAARVRVGSRVEVELDGTPGRRFPGEVSFVADEANFTPEKIETRSDRLGQVYRAKVRILEEVEDLRPGTEGNVYLLDGNTPPGARGERTAGP